MEDADRTQLFLVSFVYTREFPKQTWPCVISYSSRKEAIIYKYFVPFKLSWVWQALLNSSVKSKCTVLPISNRSLSSMCADSMDAFDTLTIRPYQPSLLVSHLDGIQCLHRPDECKFLLVCLHFARFSWMICEMVSWWLYSCCFFWGDASKIYSKQHSASLFSFYLAFFPFFISSSGATVE